MSIPDTGDPAPPFRLKDQHAAVRTLAEFRGRALVMFFYPEDDTPLCTREACAFRDELEALTRAGAAVVGVSPDTVESHSAFANKQRFSFPLLADVPGRDRTPKVCASYGVWREKNMYGNVVVGIVRTTVLIDAAGVIVRRWNHVKVNGHASKVLAAVQQLSAIQTDSARRDHSNSRGSKSRRIR